MTPGGFDKVGIIKLMLQTDEADIGWAGVSLPQLVVRQVPKRRGW